MPTSKYIKAKPGPRHSVIYSVSECKKSVLAGSLVSTLQETCNGNLQRIKERIFVSYFPQKELLILRDRLIEMWH